MEKKKFNKKKLGSYPFFNVLLSITVALFVLGMLGAILLHISKLKTNIQKNIEVQVLLNNALSEGQINKIEKTLINKPFTAFENGSPLVAFVSKTTAAKSFQSDIEFLGYNPLPDIFLVNINAAYQQKDSLEVIKSELESVNGVTEVYYEPDFIQSINKNLTNITLALSGLGLFLILAVIILINNTIKLALFSQRFLIRSMQLVGAKAWFIKKPFVLRAAMHGVIAGIVASCAILLIQFYTYTQIEGLESLHAPYFTWILLGSTIIIGGIIGFFATLRAINKYLKLSLDELY